jgi:hypothetical protein
VPFTKKQALAGRVMDVASGAPLMNVLRADVASALHVSR